MLEDISAARLAFIIILSLASIYISGHSLLVIVIIIILILFIVFHAGYRRIAIASSAFIAPAHRTRLLDVATYRAFNTSQSPHTSPEKPAWKLRDLLPLRLYHIAAAVT